jgi:metal-responsive CopG/Arc/MetJ family transcriptional regulator
MEFVRINISLPKETVKELSRRLPPRKRSRFIAEAVQRYLHEQEAQRLAAEYEEAAEEIRRVNQDLAGVLDDGLH